jgi:hypothetical protein
MKFGSSAKSIATLQCHLSRLTHPPPAQGSHTLTFPTHCRLTSIHRFFPIAALPPPMRTLLDALTLTTLRISFSSAVLGADGTLPPPIPPPPTL